MAEGGRWFTGVCAACLTVAAQAGCSSESSSETQAGGASPTSSTTTGGQGGSGGTGGAAGAAGGAGGQASGYCTSCGEPVSAGSVANGAVTEASGIVASSLVADVLFVHNDSGETTPRFFAVSSTGADEGTFTATASAPTDWEDVARGPCPAGSCLYFGDFGDNDEARASYAIVRATEPATVGAGEHDAMADELPFVYPDGSHNAETLLVHPVSGEIVVVTKTPAGEPAPFYRFPTPLTPGETVTLELMGSVLPPDADELVTGGDVHPATAGVLLRTYHGLYFYPMQSGGSIVEALANVPCPMPVAAEAQGEAVGWTADGSGYVTVSDAGSHRALNAVTCTQ